MTPLLRGRRVTGFTNEEELFLIANAREVFPFLRQDGLERDGAQFVEGAHGELEGFGVERAEALVDEEGVEPDASGARGHDFAEPER